MAGLLVVEDDIVIGRALQTGLSAHRHEVTLMNHTNHAGKAGARNDERLAAP